MRNSSKLALEATVFKDSIFFAEFSLDAPLGKS